MANTITIKSARDDDRVALWEKHPDHPDGEVFVAGEREVEAARTREVEIALKDGRVVKVDEKAAKVKAALEAATIPHIKSWLESEPDVEEAKELLAAEIENQNRKTAVELLESYIAASKGGNGSGTGD